MKNLYLLIVFIFLIACKNTEKEKMALKLRTEEKKKALTDSLRKMDSLKQIEVAYLKDSVQALKIKYKITKISGDDYGNADVEYLSLHQMVNETKKTSELEMWEPSKYKREIQSDKALHRGGELIFTMIRSSEQEAQSDNFEIIVKNNDEEEIKRSKNVQTTSTDKYVRKRKTRAYRSRVLESPASIVSTKSTVAKPLRLGGNKWVQCKVVRLDEKVEFPIYIYFIDKYYATRAKYRVDAINNN